MGNVKGGWPFVRFRIQGILRQRLQNGAGIRGKAAEHRAGVVDRFGESVTGLEAEADARSAFADAGLQRVIARMRASGHDGLGTKSCDGVAGSVELSVRSECGRGSAITLGREDAGRDECQRCRRKRR